MKNPLRTQTPTFISSITWILLGVSLEFAGAVYLFLGSYGSCFWWYGPPVLLVGFLVIYVGYKDLRKFLTTFKDDNTGESGDTYNKEHNTDRSLNTDYYDQPDSNYYEETLAEKRP
jgi:hypothetical protein